MSKVDDESPDGVTFHFWAKEGKTISYQLNGAPADWWKQVKHRALDEGISVKTLIFRALDDYLRAGEQD